MPPRPRVSLLGLALLTACVGAPSTELEEGSDALDLPTVGPRPRALPTPCIAPDSQPGADDDARLASAIQHAAGTPVCLSREYTLNKALDLPSHTHLVGTGPNAVLHFTWFSPGLAAVDPGGLAYLQNSDPRNGNTDISLENFVVRGASDGTPSGSSADAAPNGGLALGLRVWDTTYLTVQHMHFVNIPGGAISGFGLANSSLTDNDLDHLGRSGVSLFPSHDLPTRQVDILRNHVHFLGDDGIAVASTTQKDCNFSWTPNNLEIRSNLVESWASAPPDWIARGIMQGRGIAVLGGSNIDVVNNVIRNIAESGVLVRGSDLPGQLRPDTTPWVARQVTVRNNDIRRIGFAAVGEQRSGFFESAGIETAFDLGSTIEHNTVGSTVGPAYDLHKVDHPPLPADSCTKTATTSDDDEALDGF